MNSPKLVALLWLLFSACGEEAQFRTRSSSARLLETAALGECVDDQCPQGETCVRYSLRTGEAKRCVRSEQICTVLECDEGEQCFVFTSWPPIATCARVISKP